VELPAIGERLDGSFRKVGSEINLQFGRDVLSPEHGVMTGKIQNLPI